MQTGLSVTYGFYTERENPSEALRGYAVFVIPQGLKYGLLDYLAILPAYRGSGIGQWFLRKFLRYYYRRIPNCKDFLLKRRRLPLRQTKYSGRFGKKKQILQAVRLSASKVRIAAVWCHLYGVVFYNCQ